MYVPAMSTKIIEWSRRFIRLRAGSDHAIRWYAALAPNTPASPVAKIAAASRAFPVFARAMSAIPAGTETKNAISWSRPRIRGFGGDCTPQAYPSGGSGRPKLAVLTVPLLLALPTRVQVAVRYEQFPHTGGCHAGA